MTSGARERTPGDRHDAKCATANDRCRVSAPSSERRRQRSHARLHRALASNPAAPIAATMAADSTAAPSYSIVAAFLFQRDVDLLHAGQLRQRARHALDAAAAGHAVDREFLLDDGAHVCLLVDDGVLRGGVADACGAGGSPRGGPPAPEQQRIADHRHRARGHRRAGDHRRQQTERRERNAEHVVDEREEQVLADLRQRRPRKLARPTPRRSRSLRSSVTSAADSALPVPAPIANDTSACASAGASLTPSPTMPTIAALRLQLDDRPRACPAATARRASRRCRPTSPRPRGRRRMVAGQHRHLDAGRPAARRLPPRRSGAARRRA